MKWFYAALLVVFSSNPTLGQVMVQKVGFGEEVMAHDLAVRYDGTVVVVGSVELPAIGRYPMKVHLQVGQLFFGNDLYPVMFEYGIDGSCSAQILPFGRGICRSVNEDGTFAGGETIFSGEEPFPWAQKYTAVCWSLTETPAAVPLSVPFPEETLQAHKDSVSVTDVLGPGVCVGYYGGPSAYATILGGQGVVLPGSTGRTLAYSARFAGDVLEVYGTSEVAIAQAPQFTRQQATVWRVTNGRVERRMLLPLGTAVGSAATGCTDDGVIYGVIDTDLVLWLPDGTTRVIDPPEALRPSLAFGCILWGLEGLYGGWWNGTGIICLPGENRGQLFEKWFSSVSGEKFPAKVTAVTACRKGQGRYYFLVRAVGGSYLVGMPVSAVQPRTERHRLPFRNPELRRRR